jgi:uncharacterized protein involved in oxidation of intracellular sulfur
VLTDWPGSFPNGAATVALLVEAGADVNGVLRADGGEVDGIRDPKFDVRGQAESFLQAGGQILACGTCLKLRNSQGSELCPLSTMKDLYTLIREADRVVTF